MEYVPCVPRVENDEWDVSCDYDDVTAGQDKQNHFKNESVKLHGTFLAPFRNRGLQVFVSLLPLWNI